MQLWRQILLLMLRLQFSNLGSYQLQVQFRNTVDNDIINFVGDLIPVQAIGSETEATHSVGGRMERRRLTYTYQVQCAPNFYSSTCSTFCAPVNDSTGHFTCGENGEMICLSGYMNLSPGEEGRCTLCDPSIKVCQDNSDVTTTTIGSTVATLSAGLATTVAEVTASEGPENGNSTRNELEGSAEDLSGGEVAGIVLSILVISAVVAVGTFVGGLAWKYQPWEKSNMVVTKSVNSALNNPIYELNNVPKQPQIADTRQITISVESSPLYSSGAVGDNATMRSQFMENHNLLGILRMPQRSRSQEPITPPVKRDEGKGSFAEKSISRSAMNISENQDPAGNAIVAVTIDPYGSYKDSYKDTAANGIHQAEPMGFDDPNYDDVT